MSDELTVLTRFGRELRKAGVPVGPDRIAEFCRAAALVAPGQLYWAGRATLVPGPRLIDIYDRVFAEFFGGAHATGPRAEVRVTVDAALEQATEVGVASPLELLRRKSFADCTREELEALAGLMASSPLAPPLRRSRRLARARRGLPDLRRTLRASLRAGGDPVERAWRRRRLRARPIVLLVDVSGSMSANTRALLLYAHVAVHAVPHCEAFCFGTRLTRLTPVLAASHPDEALARAAELALDRDGGTRIGTALKTFLDEFGHRGVARGAVVVICSDGLETGDPGVLGEQAARLARLAYRVVWLNPLLGDPDFEPLMRGMAAALPHVDVFASCHSFESLEAVSTLLARAAGRRDTAPHSPAGR